MLVIQRLQGVSDGLGPYWDSGELNQLLELARIAAWVAGCRNLGQSLLMISRELPEEQNACQASGAVEQLAPLAERARVLALRLNPLFVSGWCHEGCSGKHYTTLIAFNIY